jgi:hypothetical protein
MEQFTPGPWRYSERLNIVHAGRKKGEFRNIADIYLNNIHDHIGKANANLIASAPDMYEALKIVRGYRMQTHHGDDKCLAIIDAVLAKANPNPSPKI